MTFLTFSPVFNQIRHFRVHESRQVRGGLQGRPPGRRRAVLLHGRTRVPRGVEKRPRKRARGLGHHLRLAPFPLTRKATSTSAIGKTDFKKPISCHLYPIRAVKLHEHIALNYDRWHICSPACSLGEELSVPVYKFLKDALIRKFGQDWYIELEKLIENDQPA